MSDKKNSLDREEYEQIMKKLDLPLRSPAEEEKEPEQFNPWNMRRKTKLKSRFFTSLSKEQN